VSGFHPGAGPSGLLPSCWVIQLAHLCWGARGRGAPPILLGGAACGAQVCAPVRPCPPWGAPGRAGGAQCVAQAPHSPPPSPASRGQGWRLQLVAAGLGGAGRGPGRAMCSAGQLASSPLPTYGCAAQPLACAKHSVHIPRGNTSASPTSQDRSRVDPHAHTYPPLPQGNLCYPSLSLSSSSPQLKSLTCPCKPSLYHAQSISSNQHHSL
jgi:hypothetical protein